MFSGLPRVMQLVSGKFWDELWSCKSGVLFSGHSHGAKCQGTIYASHRLKYFLSQGIQESSHTPFSSQVANPYVLCRRPLRASVRTVSSWEMTVMETVDKGHREEQTTVAWKHTAQAFPEMVGLLYANWKALGDYGAQNISRVPIV